MFINHLTLIFNSERIRWINQYVRGGAQETQKEEMNKATSDTYDSIHGMIHSDQKKFWLWCESNA